MHTTVTTDYAAGKMSHDKIMAATDGALYIVTLRGTSKLVRDGVTLVRASALTDGTFEVRDGLHRMAMPNWQSCAEFIAARAAVEAMRATAAYLVDFVRAA